MYTSFAKVYAEGSKDFSDLLSRNMDFNLDEIKMEFDAQYHYFIQRQAFQFKEILM